jgi:hypothetical protein
MKKVERSKKLNHLLDVKDSIAYLQERVRLASGADLAVIQKNLNYALQKKEELCKQVGFGGSTNSSTTSQHLEGKI